MTIRPRKRNSESKEKFRLNNSFSTHEHGYRNYYFMRVKAFLIKTGCKIRKIYRKIYILAETPFYRLIIDIGKVLFLFINYRSILWLITNTGVILTQTFYGILKSTITRSKRYHEMCDTYVQYQVIQGWLFYFSKLHILYTIFSITVSWSLRHIHNKYVISFWEIENIHLINKIQLMNINLSRKTGENG